MRITPIFHHQHNFTPYRTRYLNFSVSSVCPQQSLLIAHFTFKHTATQGVYPFNNIIYFHDQLSSHYCHLGRRLDPGLLLHRTAILRMESHQQRYDNCQYLLRCHQSDRNMIGWSPNSQRDHLYRVLGKCDYTKGDRWNSLGKCDSD
jgi:hypothetical protein